MEFLAVLPAFSFVRKIDYVAHPSVQPEGGAFGNLADQDSGCAVSIVFAGPSPGLNRLREQRHAYGRCVCAIILSSAIMWSASSVAISIASGLIAGSVLASDTVR